MNRFHLLTITLLAGSAGCTVLGFGDEPGNDTQLGDDDAEGDTGEEPQPDPQQVPDHGPSQYCVDRWAYNAEATGSLSDIAVAHVVSVHERSWSPKSRSYKSWLDTSDKPSPMIVPPMCGNIDPVWPDSWDDSTASCLVSGYHVALPSITPPGEGIYQFPYGTNLITGTIGNPPESGRHTWMAELCCATPMTPTEIAEWSFPPMDAQLYGKRNGDCQIHAEYKGVHDDVFDYVAPYDPLDRILRTGAASQCVNNHGVFNPVSLAPIKAASLGEWLPWHVTRQQTTAPLNLNYEWVASWGLVDWDDFAAFGATIDAVIQSLLSVLYLPPEGFEHPRYGGASGCAYSVALKYNDPAGWQARVTCPYGYYATLGDFDSLDLATRIDGVVGHCVIDGVGSDDGMGSLDGPIVLAPDQQGHAHLYYVHDARLVGDLLEKLEGVATGTSTSIEDETPDAFVSDALAAIVLDDYEQPLLREGDVIRWWSTPGRDAGLRDAFDATLGYDVDELAGVLGWSLDEAERWADSAPPVKLSVLLPDADLPPELAERRGNDLRSRNTFTLRIDRGGFVMIVHLRAA